MSEPYIAQALKEGLAKQNRSLASRQKVNGRPRYKPLEVSKGIDYLEVSNAKDIQVFPATRDNITYKRARDIYANTAARGQERIVDNFSGYMKNSLEFTQRMDLEHAYQKFKK